MQIIFTFFSWVVLSLPFLITPFFVSWHLRFIFPIVTIAFLVWLLKKDNRERVFIFLVISYFILFAFLLTDVILILFQGKTFDLRFFDLFNFEMIFKGIELFPWYALIIGFCLVAVVIMLRYLFKKLTPFEYVQSKFSTIIMIAITFLILFSPNSFSLFSAKVKNYYVYNQSIQESSLPDIKLEATKGRNLLLIYLESYEKEFIEEKYFPDLAPFLQEFSQNSVSFENHQMTIGANFTMSGIFASQCGATYHYKDLDNVICLGDILHEGGYHQVFMQAADLKFEGKDKYFLKYHFDEIWGQETLIPKGDDPDKKNSWGIFDEDLFEYVYDKFLILNQKYLKDGTPYHLSMLTVDTHNGDPSPSCPKYNGKFSENHFFQSYHCTDYLLANFIKKIKSQSGSEDLVIAILGDHLQNFDMYASQLKQMNRRVLALIDTHEESSKILQSTAHIDFVQTLLPLLNVKTNAYFLFGGDALTPLPYDHLNKLHQNKEQKKTLMVIKSGNWLDVFGFSKLKKMLIRKRLENSDINTRQYTKEEIEKYYYSMLNNLEPYIKDEDIAISYSSEDDLLFVSSKKKLSKLKIDLYTDQYTTIENTISTDISFIFDKHIYIWDMGNLSYKYGKVNNLVLEKIEYDKALGNLIKPKNIQAINNLTELELKDGSILFKYNLHDPKEGMISGVVLEYEQDQRVAEFDLSDLYIIPSYGNRIKLMVMYHDQVIYKGDVSDEKGTEKEHIKVDFIDNDRNITIMLEALKGIERGWAWGNVAEIKVDVER